MKYNDSEYEIYREMYYKLFNRVSDIITELEQIQCQCEEIFLNELEKEQKTHTLQLVIENNYCKNSKKKV